MSFDPQQNNARPSPSQEEVDVFCPAAGEGYEATVMAFLDKYPAAINARSSSGDNALVWAASREQEHMIRLLLARGAAVDARDQNGWTALMDVAWSGHIGIAALLLDYNASVDETRERGWTALMDASGRGHTAVVALLLERGADIGMKNADGQTALALARWQEQEETMALLTAWPETQRQRLAAQQEREAVLSAVRLEKLRQLRPPKPVLKRGLS